MRVYIGTGCFYGHFPCGWIAKFSGGANVASVAAWNFEGERALLFPWLKCVSRCAISIERYRVGFSPILIVVIAMIIGLIVAVVAKKLIGMKIPIMERCTVEIAGAAALSVLGFGTAIAGTVDITLLLDSVVGTGFIAVLFILCTMAIQHPFNACLGPNEDQLRTLKCACSTAFLSMFITGFLAIYTGGVAWVLILIVGFIGWYVSFNKFVDASCDAAASVKWAGLWPKLED